MQNRTKLRSQWVENYFSLGHLGNLFQIRHKTEPCFEQSISYDDHKKMEQLAKIFNVCQN